MGYELHITRADSWLESESAPITLEEWRDYVATDPQMRMEGFAEANVADGSRLRYEHDGLAVWIAYSGHDHEGNMAWFNHQEGRIVVKNPDEEIIAKMRIIAAALNAKVFGDDGESYFPSQPNRARKPWWKFWSQNRT
ncbi:MAG: hypothetical protein U0175_20255 [Caldilineaceae bacterium]